MRVFPWLFVTFLVSGAIAVDAADQGSGPPYTLSARPGEALDDSPLRRLPSGLRADTTWFGQYEVIAGETYAIPFGNKVDGSWTFDRGTGPFGDPDRIENGEGWRSVDLTENHAAFFRVIDESLDLDGAEPPIIYGERSLWVGVDKPQADSLCWCAGPGYGNDWRQRVTSESLPYDGSGSLTLSFAYWLFSEPCYDGVQLYLQRADGTELLLNPHPGGCTEDPAYEGGSFTGEIGHYTAPAIYEREILVAEIGEAQAVRFVFEFTSDGGWSDEDCEFETDRGPFGADSVVIAGSGIDMVYDFEDGLQGWEPGFCTPIGGYAGVADVGGYTILDACACRLSGNVLEMHDGVGDAGFHPVGQNVMVCSPICDILSAAGDGPHAIFLELDVYADMPLANGVLHRPGWRYYPWTCPETGSVRWSPRVGQSSYNYFGDQVFCTDMRYGGTDVSSGIPVPADAEEVMAILEIQADCAAFSIDPCSGETNFTPIYDNIAVGVTAGSVAPVVVIPNGQRFQDVGSYPSDLFDPRAEGPANVTRDLNMNTAPGTEPDVCGDTLSVSGPIPDSDPNSRWEAKLWFRVSRRSPFQADRESGAETRYKIWKDRVSDGAAIDRPVNPEFAWAWMDSAQLGPIVKRNEFISAFREDDDDFIGELHPENEILWDDVLRPGTQIEYFITSNYVTTPGNLFHLPDTTGGYFLEFEILPGVRIAHVENCGGVGFDYCATIPATLYIDAYGRGGQLFIENALRTVLNGLPLCQEELGCEIPYDRHWDRYDYDDACSCWNAPFMRGTVEGSNNGMTLQQILGYRSILINMGVLGEGNTQDQDYLLYEQWLTSPECHANVNRQLFIVNGDQAGSAVQRPGGQDIDWHGEAFLQNRLCADVYCDAFSNQGYDNDPDCGEENDSYCIRWLAADGGAFPTELDVDAYGNGCPNLNLFNVYSPREDAIGNRTYAAEDGTKEMSFAQIVHEELGAEVNYRAVIDGVSWHHMTARVGPGGDGGQEWCPRDLPSIVEAAASEIGLAMRWGQDAPDNGSIPQLTDAQILATCQGTWSFPTDVEEIGGTTPVDRLFANRPNPFNPRTVIRFSLAEDGPVDLTIYDVGGRRVRTLVDGPRKTGLHAIEWDGYNDAGHALGSGVYWCQMETNRYRSTKKMVVLK